MKKLIQQNSEATEVHPHHQTLRILVIYIGLPIATLFLWLIWMASVYNGLLTRESMELAQLAEHLSQGDGFSTSVIRPLSLGIVPEVNPHPDVLNAPIFPLLESILFLVGGAQDRMAAVTSGLGWLLSVWLTYLMGRVLMRSRKAALLGCVLLMLNVPLLGLSVSGTPETWSTTFLTASLLIAAVAARKIQEMSALKELNARAELRIPRPWKYSAVSGICTGLLVMNQYSLLIPIAISLFIFWYKWGQKAAVFIPSHRRKRSIALGTNRNLWSGLKMGGMFLLMVFMTCLPWMIRNTVVTGNPLFSLSSFTIMQGTGTFPGHSIWRSQEDAFAPLFFLFYNFPSLIYSSLRALPPLPMFLAHLFNPVTLVLFVVGLFGPSAPPLRVMKRLTISILVLTIIVFSIFSKEIQTVVALVPTITVLAAAALLHICRQKPYRLKINEYWKQGRHRWRVWTHFFLAAHRHIFLGGLFILLASTPFLGSRSKLRTRRPLQSPPGLEQAMALSTKDDLILTDAPWAVAWWGKHNAAWIPQQQALAQEWMSNTVLRLNVIYLRGFPGITKAAFAPWWLELVRQPAQWMGFSANRSEDPRTIIRTRNRK